MEYYSSIQNDLIKQVSKQLDDYLIEGLSKKGFKFSNNKEMELFVSERCKCVHDPNTNVKTFYVDNIPFAVHKCEPKFEIVDNYQINAGLGAISFID